MVNGGVNTAGEESVTPVKFTREQLIRKRTTLRRKITSYCKEIREFLGKQGSRRAVKSLLEECRGVLLSCEELNDQILESADDSEMEKELALQVAYRGKLEEVAEEVDEYLVLRRDDASSICSQVRFTVPSVGSSAPRDAEVCSEVFDGEVAERHERITRELEAAQAETQRLQRELQGLGIEQTGFTEKGGVERKAPARFPGTSSEVERFSPHSVVSWRRDQPITVREQKVASPDGWIDDYIEGRETREPWSSEVRYSSSIHADLGVYGGSALQWFSWIDLFKALVHHSSKSPGEKLAILRRSVKGDCADIVYSLGGGEDAYKEALCRLKTNCGRRDVMRAAHLTALEKLDPGKGSPSAFKKYAEKVRTHLFDLSRMQETAQQDIIEKITAKLAIQDRLAWKEATSLGKNFPNLLNFSGWLCTRAAAYLNAYDIAAEQEKWDVDRPDMGKGARIKARAHKTSSATANPSMNPKSGDYAIKSCFRCSGDHRLEECPEFISLPVSDRFKFVSSKKICFSCLRGTHQARDCRQSKGCSIGECKRRHNRLLHEEPEAITGLNLHAKKSARTIAVGVLDVTVLSSRGKREKATILLDEGSDTTLVREGLLEKLGLRGRPQTLNISGVGGKQGTYQSQSVEVLLEVQGERAPVSLRANSVPEVCQPVEGVRWPELKKRWSHLSDLPLSEAGGRIDILLGLDHAELLHGIESRVGRKGEPIASRTRLGWVARGVIEEGNPESASIRLIHRVFRDPLEEQLKRFCDTESFGTENSPKKLLPPEDELAVQIVDAGTRKLEIGYEVPLPWKKDEPSLPNNRVLAEHRLEGLVRRFQKDPQYRQDYELAIRKYVNEQHAQKVIDLEELKHPRQYFLPHHGVYKKSAEVRKLRVVFDSAAVFRGKSLNQALLTGPPLQNELPHVLIRFREGAIAFTADIEAMFSRIRLRPEDARYHRFLWPDAATGKIEVYQMNRVTFGDCCSPFVAIQTTRRVAEDFGENNPEAMRAVYKNLYVDDYLDSTRTAEEARKRCAGIRELLAKGDFHLTKWTSNSAELMDWLNNGTQEDKGPSRTTQTVAIGEDKSVSKVLGVRWEPQGDNLVFEAHIGEVIFTRRGLLSKMAGIFDPLGLLSPVTVKAKIKHRELTLQGLSWDQPIPAEQEQWWTNWINGLGQLKHLVIPRCIFQKEEKSEYSELHTFCDASQEAFSAAVYVRTVYLDEAAKTVLVMAKTKLSPVKSISVAKLELQAALLGARLSKYVGAGLTRPIRNRYFWTDSSCVRNWVRSSASFYKPFVSHRIGEIQTLTEPGEWRHVPGRLNCSDLATRSALDIDQCLNPTWYAGPEFLEGPENSWPRDIPWATNPEELRPSCEVQPLLARATEAKPSTNWEEVSVCPAESAGYTKITESLLEILRQIQEEEFGEELLALRTKGSLKRSSKLLPLNPFVGEDCLLRVGGRIGRAELPFEQRHPIILPSKHPVTMKIIEEFHRRLYHAGTDYVLSHLRQFYWVIKGREAVKKARRMCQSCRKESAPVATQQMAELPTERLAVFKPPFFHTSVDYFGPLEVSYGRNAVAKRYGAIFTCMTTRAVYLDLAKSLSKDDFLLVLRRFISVRGKPHSLYSDNGTNFVAAERELREAVRQFEGKTDVDAFCAAQGIQWKFQPPNAPHFGGVHESLVRSTKKALYRALQVEQHCHRHPSEDVMRTLLYEVAGFLNGRPLTYVSSDPFDLRPITPRDLLNQLPVTDVPAEDGTTALPREHFKYVQRLSKLFWDLWMKSYLPTLTSRNKWLLKRRNFSIGDVVLIADPNQPRGQWNMGRISQVFPGKDGLIRTAEVSTEKGTYLRPIHRLCLLDDSATSNESGTPSSCSGGEDVPAK